MRQRTSQRASHLKVALKITHMLVALLPAPCQVAIFNCFERSLALFIPLRTERD